MDALVGGMPDAVRFVVAFIVVLGLIAGAALVWRRFGASVLLPTGSRGRQPRLAVIDAAAVDGRRRLVLIRRDNTEHLLMIGGPTDIVIEPNIVRGGANGASRDSRPLPMAELSGRLVDGPAWSPLGEIPRAARTEAADPVRLAAMTVHPEPLRPEPLRSEPSRPEPSRPEPLRADPLRSQSLRAEPVRPETIRPEPAHAEPIVQEVAHSDADRQDDLHEETARQDAIRQEALRLELRQEAMRREASRQEAARKEGMRQEAVRSENSRIEPAPPELPRPARERAGSEPVRTSRTEPAFRTPPQPDILEQSRPDFEQELTQAMNSGEQMPHVAEPPEPGRLTAPAPVSLETRRAPAASSSVPAAPPTAQSTTQESDIFAPAQPQRAPSTPAPREGAFQSTGVIRESPQSRPTPPRPSPTDENNLAEMAQRLEVALRRPTKPVAVAPPPPVRSVARLEPSISPPARPTVPPPPAVPGPRAAALFESAPVAPVPGPRGSQPAPANDLRADPRTRPAPEASAPFESLEEEMANLLGRATGKT